MTRTFVSVTSPVFVTTIVNGAVAPLAMVCSFTFFVIEMPGLVGGGVWVTVTCAESVAVTSGPDGGVPVAIATFVKLAVTLAALQV